MEVFLTTPDISKSLWKLWRAQDHHGRLAIHYAAESGDVAVMKALVYLLDLLQTSRSVLEHFFLQEGVHFSRENFSAKHEYPDESPGSWMSSVDDNGHTVLHIAAINDHGKLVEFLLNTSKVDANLRDGEGRAALDMAEAHGHLWIADMLREAPVKQGTEIVKVATTGSNLEGLPNNLSSVRTRIVKRRQVDRSTQTDD
jgi:ankyrin repeat protein